MQTWRANEYGQNAAFVSELGSPVLALLSPQASEHILDLGCGDGTLALHIQQAGSSVVAVDFSESMVAAAQQKGLNAQVMNGEVLTFESEFDAVFTNAALHWMLDYKAVIAGVHQVLKPTGRFVGEFGGAGNIQCLLEAIAAVFNENPEFGEFQSPWYFPSPEDYTKALAEGGFQVDYMELIPRATPLKAGVQPWLKIFADQVIADLTPNQQQTFLDAVTEKVRPHLYTDNAGWVADYVRLRFVARPIS
ncbi:Methyltransferase type 11 [[Leptolyngbya] sp. PCC 7376]|uniref:class I SAM-dependent methyltransferase n=1 Tax=[Leptolyngbya] sp. PCC 7376 TaxID=111781 RepID=UPI00029EDCA5|nr:class I SAM-dependent methyltransferase [[Leptolyngbya] sp. PCC 7376]AFY36901.1 Methyltransferase type 11 [[Leptolyngbya] sp. PCC 7376]